MVLSPALTRSSRDSRTLMLFCTVSVLGKLSSRVSLSKLKRCSSLALRRVTVVFVSQLVGQPFLSHASACLLPRPTTPACCSLPPSGRMRYYSSSVHSSRTWTARSFPASNKTPKEADELSSLSSALLALYLLPHIHRIPCLRQRGNIRREVQRRTWRQCHRRCNDPRWRGSWRWWCNGSRRGDTLTKPKTVGVGLFQRV